MIISEYAICPTNNRNYRRLKSLGYEFNIGDQVEVNVRHLSKSSRSLVFGNFNNKEKYRNTCLLKYGVDHNMKCRELFIKNQISRYRVSYIDGIRYQSSYELDFIQKCQHLNIIIEEGPTISYLFEGTDRKYHSDFYLPNFNLICEIKSEYIYNKEVKINEIKKESSIKSGYNFIFIIDKDYSNFIKIIENNANSAF